MKTSCLSSVQTKDGLLLSSKVAGLQKKWDNICQLHHTRPAPESNSYQASPPFPTVLGFHFNQDKKANAQGHSSNNTNTLSNENTCINVNSCSPVSCQKMSTLQSENPSSVISKTRNGSFLSKLREKPSKGCDLEAIEPISACSLSNSSVGDVSQASPTSVTSVTTDLGLGLCSVSSSNKLMKPANQNCCMGLAQDFSGCTRANVDVINGSVSSHPAQSSSSSSPDFVGQLDPNNFKKLFAALTKRVGWQDEAASVICQTIANGRARTEKGRGASRRGDIWLNFSGPDRCGKKKIAVALADIIYGSRENFICMDLSSQDGAMQTQLLFNCQNMNYDLRFRGKTVVDYVAEELSKMPLSVVFLENVDKADIQVQSSLSQAIRTGKFSDSHGREVSINNAIFVTTSTLPKEDQVVCHKTQTSSYSEDKILRAKGWPLQILIKHEDNIIGSKPGFLNKRKLIGSHETLEQNQIMEMAKRANRTSSWNLDLNIPAEESEVLETDDATVDDSVSENPMPWLQDFFSQSIKNVVFKPFDFNALAEKVSNDINQTFRKLISSECLLEIDSKVMEQLLAVVYLSDENRVVADWIGQVLSRGFAEVKNKYSLNTHTVVKLVPYEEDLPSEDKTLGVCVPPRIILNYISSKA